MARIKTIILVIKNAIEFYKFLHGQISAAIYHAHVRRDRANFQVLNDTTLSLDERLKALKEIENRFNNL